MASPAAWAAACKLTRRMASIAWASIDADTFARDMAADAMATEKLRDGIAAFTKDLVALREGIAARLRG